MLEDMMDGFWNVFVWVFSFIGSDGDYFDIIVGESSVYDGVKEIKEMICFVIGDDCQYWGMWFFLVMEIKMVVVWFVFKIDNEGKKKQIDDCDDFDRCKDEFGFIVN